MLNEADEIRVMAKSKLAMPALAVGGGSGDFTATATRQVASDVTAETLDGIGHYVAMEAPDRLASTFVSFFRDVDGDRK